MSCPFCSELASRLPPEAIADHVNDRILWETDNYVVLADISPLVPGHVLLIPRRHDLSFGAADAATRPELDRLVHSTRQALLGNFGHPGVLLEHGSDATADGGGCVAHAHWHLVPADIDMAPALNRFAARDVTERWVISEWADRDEAYLWLETPSGRRVIADKLQGIPKQFLRIEVASRVGVVGRNWDWRTTILSEHLVETVQRLKAS